MARQLGNEKRNEKAGAGAFEAETVFEVIEAPEAEAVFEAVLEAIEAPPAKARIEKPSPEAGVEAQAGREPAPEAAAVQATMRAAAVTAPVTAARQHWAGRHEQCA
jgi:hypothetical protein